MAPSDSYATLPDHYTTNTKSHQEDDKTITIPEHPPKKPSVTFTHASRVNSTMKRLNRFVKRLDRFTDAETDNSPHSLRPLIGHG